MFQSKEKHQKKYVDNKKKQLNPDWLEKEVIKLGMKLEGKITIPEICVHTSLTVDQAKETMERLVQKEVASINVTERGAKVYILNDRANGFEKASSHSIM